MTAWERSPQSIGGKTFWGYICPTDSRYFIRSRRTQAGKRIYYIYCQGVRVGAALDLDAAQKTAMGMMEEKKGGEGE